MMSDDNEVEDVSPAERIPMLPPPLVEPVAEDDESILFQDPREAEQRRLARRPSIDHLHDAVVIAEDKSLVFVPDVGERVVLERRTTLLAGNPWLDTRLLSVVSVDEVTGMIRLHDDDLKQTCYTNYIAPNLHRMKLPPPKGRWDAQPPAVTPGQAQEGFSTHEGGNQPLTKDGPQDGPSGEKKGRGRPKGSKNRPREVVQAEKAVLQAERRAKKAQRAAKKK